MQLAGTLDRQIEPVSELCSSESNGKYLKEGFPVSPIEALLRREHLTISINQNQTRNRARDPRFYGIVLWSSVKKQREMYVMCVLNAVVVVQTLADSFREQNCFIYFIDPCCYIESSLGLSLRPGSPT